MSKGKKPEFEVTGATQCKCSGCKKTEARFSFCEEHYEWFKFGLINKAGAKVPDFDRKQEHFVAHFEKIKSAKVA